MFTFGQRPLETPHPHKLWIKLYPNCSSTSGVGKLFDGSTASLGYELSNGCIFLKSKEFTLDSSASVFFRGSRGLQFAHKDGFGIK